MAKRQPLPLGVMFPGMNVPISSHYGNRFHPIKHVNRLHAGTDFALGLGTPIRAPYDGTVSFMGPVGGYGNQFKLDHGGGYVTSYNHLKGFAPNLKKGGQIKAGDLLGYVGSTGLSTGPHLHMELLQGGKPINIEGFDWSIMTNLLQGKQPQAKINTPGARSMAKPAAWDPTPPTPPQGVMAPPIPQLPMNLPARDPFTPPPMPTGKVNNPANEMQRTQSLIDGSWYAPTPKAQWPNGFMPFFQ